MSELTTDIAFIECDFHENETRVVAYYLSEIEAGEPTFPPMEHSKVFEIVPMPEAPPGRALIATSTKRKGKGRHKQRYP